MKMYVKMFPWFYRNREISSVAEKKKQGSSNASYEEDIYIRNYSQTQ